MGFDFRAFLCYDLPCPSFSGEDFFMVKWLAQIPELVLKVFSSPYRRSYLSGLGRKIFERRQIHQMIGGALMGVVLVTTVFNSPSWAFEFLRAAPLSDQEIILTTEESRRFPVAGVISQGFLGGHLGWDITAPQDTAVYPLMEGIVESVGHQPEGFGRYLIVDHGNGFKTLYGHLANFEVKSGEKVNRGEIIGRVGTSGLTTGAHLHFEIWQENQPFSPGEVLEER